MSPADPPGGHDTVPTMVCRTCGEDVPVGAFCGSCGADPFAESGNRLGRLRIGAYAAAPDEHVLRFTLASSLFPQLPHRSRTAFRLGLVVLLVVLVVLAVLRWQAPLIAVGALGFPLLFVVYLRETDARHDLPVRLLAIAAGLGIALGIAWALVAGAIVAHSYDVALGTGEDVGHTFVEGMLIPTGGVLLVLAPAAVVRALRPSVRESLDGFVFGALGAIGFTAAATLTRLAPQLATGPTAQDQPITALLVQVGIQGLAIPVLAAAAGGLVGVALWFNRSGARRPAWRAVTAAVLVVIALYVGLGLLESLPLSDGLHLGLHLMVAALAVLALRIGIQAALLHETHDAMSPDEQVLCPNCEHVVPDTAFCPNCGVAAQAASRTSRTARRLERPHREADAATPNTRAGYAVPPGTYAATPVRQSTPRRRIARSGRRFERGGRGGRGRVGADNAETTALRVPARLRPATAGNARRDESPLHRPQWRLLVLVSRPGHGVRGDGEPRRGGAGLRRRRHRHPRIVR